MLARTDGDMLVAISRADRLREAAGVAAKAAGELEYLKKNVIDGVQNAREQGFEVGADYSVIDTRSDNPFQRAQRQTLAQIYSADLRHRAAALAACDDEVAAEITRQAGDVAVGLFGGGNNGHVQPAGRGRPAPTVQLAAAVKHAPPPSPAPALADSPVAQTLTPRPVATPSPAAPAPKATPSVIKPADPLTTSPGGGRPTSLSPGMLNAAALRGPVTTMPPTTTATGTAAQPLAYVPHEPPRPPVTPTPPHPALLDPGNIAPAHQPQTTAPNTAPPPTHPLLTPQPSAPPEPANPPAAPVHGPPAPAPGVGGPGIQMLGTGLGRLPQTPSIPMPRDPAQPVPPPPPGVPTSQRPDVSGWTAPPRAHDVENAQQNLQDLEDAIKRHNSNPPNPYDPNAVAAYNGEANYYNSWAAQLEGEVESWNGDYTPAPVAQTQEKPNAPYWAHPDPSLPQSPTGQRGGPMRVEPGTNGPATIDGIPFKGHALDEMQSDGIPLSAVNRALRVGAIEPGKYGRTIFYDAVNNISVVQDPSGEIVTVSYGHLHE